MPDCLRILSFLAFAVVLFSSSAVGNHCFRNREPNGRLGSCSEEIQGVNTKARCCTAGGAGWTVRTNGKRCEDACEGQEPEEPLVVEPEAPDPPQVDEGEVQYCFRTRQARGSLGACEDEIGRKTKEACCRHGGKGWTEKSSGKRCEDTCSGVVDTGPDGHCFSNLRPRRRRNQCSNSLGEMGKLACCQLEGGQGWSDNSDGTDCVVPCEQDAVTVDGGWSVWSDYSECSKTCEEGTQRRTRRCNDPSPSNGGADCEGVSFEIAICFEGPCPIHGGWGVWGRAGECAATCQSEGSSVYKEQQRSCDDPVPEHGGRYCEGASSRRIRCRLLLFCPIDGGWSEFSEWSRCSQTCEDGIQIRERTCDNPPPQHGGRNCTGQKGDQQICTNRRRCPIHGEWTDWGAWTECDAPRCGVDGTRLQSRTCTNPVPKYGGNYCVGRIINTEPCSACPKWSEWSIWLPCTDGCKRNSVRDRFRKCEGKGVCDGNFMETESCKNLDPCPDDDDGGSGSGSGSGSGPDIDIICDDEDECIPYKQDDNSYSYLDAPSDPEPVITQAPCQDFDYSLYDYNIPCNENPAPVPSDPVDPVDPVDPEYDSYSLDDGDVEPVDVPGVGGVDLVGYDSYSLDDGDVEPVDVPGVGGDDPVGYDSYSLDDGDVEPVDVPGVGGDDPVGYDSYSLDDGDVEPVDVPGAGGDDPVVYDSYSLDDGDVEPVDVPGAGEDVDDSVSYSV